MTSCRYRVGALIACLAAFMLLLMSHALAAPSTPAPPANDDRDSATPLTLGTPVTGTTVGSTVQTNEAGSDCTAQPDGTVWYSISFGKQVPTGVGVALAAGGNLDGSVDIFEKVRSSNDYQTCGSTDRRGIADVSFVPTANTTYLIRVDQRHNSDPGPFRLQLFALAPPPSPPGVNLTAGHVVGRVDANFTTTAAYSMELTAATTYKIDLVNRNSDGGCFGLSIFAPGTSSFTNGGELRNSCAGYSLFTPTQTGRYSFVVSAASDVIGYQRYGLAVAPATSADMAPGISLPNLTTYHGLLRGNVDTDLRLFSIHVTQRSQLTLTLSASSNANFSIQLLSDHGRQIDEEDSQMVVTTNPGHYYVVVQANDYSYGTFTLTRQSQTFSHIRTVLNQAGAVQIALGQSVTLGADLSGADGGTVQFELEYFDPVSGWQFRGYRTAGVVNNRASLTFTPPVPGHWRFISSYSGTRSAASSQGGYAELNVTSTG